MDPKNIIDANPTTGPLSHINQYRIYWMYFANIHLNRIFLALSRS
jgi:hypothetical protein